MIERELHIMGYPQDRTNPPLIFSNGSTDNRMLLVPSDLDIQVLEKEYFENRKK